MQVSSVWWQDFFTGLYNECWRQLRPDENTRAEADFVEAVVARPGARFLDVPSGTGRLARELARRGHRTTAVDLSTEMLASGRELAAAAGVDVEWHEREMRDLPWSATFDAVLCFGISFGFLDDDGERAFVAAAARALKPGGKLIIDTNKVLEVVLPSFKPRGWAQLGDILMTYEHEYDMQRGRVDTEYRFHQNGVRETRISSHRAYAFRELCDLLRGAGFTSFEAYGALNRQPFRVGSLRLLLVASTPPDGAASH